MVAVLIAAACCLGAPETTAPAVSQPAGTESVIAYIADHAIPLRSVQAGSGFDDLEPLKKTFKDVRVVGLGEATHGTREFFQLKHRLLEFLVERMGFNAFGIEASYTACLAIDDYVMYGRGDPAQALAGQKFWTWDTHEVAEMIEWMRQYNSQRPESRRIRFLGFDIQTYDHDIGAVITGFLEKVSPEDLPEAQAALAPGDGGVARLRALVDSLGRNRGRLTRRGSEEEFQRVFQQARILLQNRELDAQPRRSQYVTRDRYMAENIRSLMETLGPRTKMVVWAHNSHVSNRRSDDYALMGSFLREWYGAAYYPMGFVFNEGSFQAMLDSGKGYALTEITLPAAPEGSVPWYFARARPGGDFLVDFRPAPKTGPFAEWLMAPSVVPAVGSTFSYSEYNQGSARYIRPVIPGREYDGMVFIAKTTRARPNPTGLRPAPKQGS